MTQKIAILVAFLTGLGLIFIGARFLLKPEVAEGGYGIRFNELGDYSFHYIKGIRDVFTGMLICLFIVARKTKALGITLSTGTIIPITDLFIVLSKNHTGLTQAIPHIFAIVICAITGLLLLMFKSSSEAI